MLPKAPVFASLTRLTLAAMLAGALTACAGVLPDAARGDVAAPSSDVAAGESAGGTDLRAEQSDTAGSIATGQAQASNDILGRKVIRNGSLTIEVEAVPEAYEQVGKIATSLGGYVQEGSFVAEGGPTARRGSIEAYVPERSARLVLRVPAERYDEAIAALRGMPGTVRAASVQTRDVTGEVADLEATISNLRAVEVQYVQLLGRAQAISDILQVQDKLRQVRLEIERAQARLALTTRLTDLTTITVELTPTGTSPTPRGPVSGAAVAWDASLTALRMTATVLVMVVVFSWWLLPIAGIGMLVGRRMRARRKAALVTGAKPMAGAG